MAHRVTAISSYAIELSLQDRSFSTSEIIRKFKTEFVENDSRDPPSRSTIYRVLRQLEEDDWIQQRGNKWFPDVKSQMLGGNDESTSGQTSTDFEIELDDVL